MVLGDVRRPHPEGPDHAQQCLHQTIRGGDEGVGGEAHIHAGQLSFRVFISLSLSHTHILSLSLSFILSL